MVIARREGKSTAYLWCVYLGDDGDRLDVQSHEVRLADDTRPGQSSVAAMRVSTASETHILIANPSGKPVQLGDETVEGKIALLTREDGGSFRVRHVAR